MPTPENHDNQPDLRQPTTRKRKVAGAFRGFRRRKGGGAGLVIIFTALGIFVGVTAELYYGIGKVVSAGVLKDDGPNISWAKPIEVRQLGVIPSRPELQRELAELTQPLPAPRVQTDENNQQDLADLHAREDLLLENYTWADRTQGKMRIPIERAMELIAQSGLPVAPKVEHAPLLAHDSNPVVARPLTNGFARTGYELEQAQAQKVLNNRHP